MSSGDELAGYDPTTPAVTKKGSTRPAPRMKSSVAGPSKPAARKVNKPAQEADDDDDDSHDVVVLSSDDDGKKAVRTAAAKGKGKEPAATTKAAPQTNGKAKAKGKAKIVSNSEAMEVDGAQSAETEPPARNPRAARTNAKPVSEALSPPPAKRHKAESALELEITRLRRRLDEVVAQRDRLSEQLKEALQVRETEPERLLQESVSQAEASMQAQQHLLQEQAASLAHFRALPNSSLSHSLQFITRDAAAEESKGLVERMKKLEMTVKEKNTKITELEAKNKALDQQLEAEIQMAKEYRDKNQGGPKVVTNGTSRAQNGSNPVDHDVIILYEDLSNFLIRNIVRGEPPYPNIPDLREKTFFCSYTYVPPDGKPINPSIQFTLRTMWAPVDLDAATPPSSKKDLVEKMEFVPLNLENESEEFKKKLEFFNTPFIFERDQLSVFTRTLTEKLALVVEDSSDEEE